MPDVVAELKWLVYLSCDVDVLAARQRGGEFEGGLLAVLAQAAVLSSEASQRSALEME
jgi:hypothetical protein